MGDRTMTHRERMENRAERLREWAEKREVKAGAQLNSFPEIRHDIAFNTQPGRIPFRERMNAADDRARESLGKASSMEARADGIERALKGSIYSDDADAVEQLKARIIALEAEREKIKTENAAYRKAHGAELKANTNMWERDQSMPHPAYELRNLSGNIKRNRDRLAQIEREKVSGPPLRQILVRYSGECAECGEKIEKGAVAWYRKPELFCENCKPAAVPVAESAPAVDRTAEEVESELKALWTANGVPEERQAELLADVAAKASPGAQVGPFVIPSDPLVFSAEEIEAAAARQGNAVVVVGGK